MSSPKTSISLSMIALVVHAGVCREASAVEVQPAWASFYDGIAQGMGRDEGFDIALGADGSVAVVGRSWGELNVFDYITIKYAPDGTELWNRRYDGPLEQIDEAYAVGMDAAGNVIVTGTSYNGQVFSGGTDWDYVTIKYQANGALAWERRYNGPGNSWDMPMDLEVDAAGNAYIAGFSYKEPTSTGAIATHFHLLKYDPQGNIVWQHHLDLSPHLGAGARDIALDAAGNVYACGVTTRWDGGSDDDMMVVKVNPAGEVVYMTNVDAGGNGDGLAIAADAAGNAYVTGYSEILIGQLFAKSIPTTKISPSGSVLWFRDLVIEEGANHAGYGVVADGNGNVYSVGGINMGENRGVVVSYGPGGNQRWLDVYDIDPDDPFNDAWMRSVRLNSNGLVYVDVNAMFDQPQAYDYTIFVYDPANGTVVDEKRVDFGSNSDIAYAFELGSDDSIYWTGYTWRPATTGADVATAKVAGAAPVPGDATGDGVVNVDDLIAVIHAWGACGSPCPADLNQSGFVDVDDLIMVISNWS